MYLEKCTKVIFAKIPKNVIEIDIAEKYLMLLPLVSDPGTSGQA
jgi:hypothetical protein